VRTLFAALPQNAVQFLRLREKQSTASREGTSQTRRSNISLKKEYQLMLIEWVDSSRVGEGWVDLEDIGEPTPHICVSVSFLIRENKLGKILVPTIADVKHKDNRRSHGGNMIRAGQSSLKKRDWRNFYRFLRCRLAIAASARMRPAAGSPLRNFFASRDSSFFLGGVMRSFGGGFLAISISHHIGANHCLKANRPKTSARICGLYPDFLGLRVANSARPGLRFLGIAFTGVGGPENAPRWILRNRWLVSSRAVVVRF